MADCERFFPTAPLFLPECPTHQQAKHAPYLIKYSWTCDRSAPVDEALRRLLCEFYVRSEACLSHIWDMLVLSHTRL